MNLTNANIKSRKEALERLKNGEVFYTRFGSKVFYDENEFNPYRAKSDPLGELIADFSVWKKESEWYENIPPQGVLCWVNNEYPQARDSPPVIIKVQSNSVFFATGLVMWKYATPLTNEEIKAYYFSKDQ